MKVHDRICPKCNGVLEQTRTRSDQCKACFLIEKRELDILSEKDRIAEWGYKFLEGPWVDKFNHRCYKILTPCGHEWSLPFTNLIKNIKKVPNSKPCGICRGR